MGVLGSVGIRVKFSPVFLVTADLLGNRQAAGFGWVLARLLFLKSCHSKYIYVISIKGNENNSFLPSRVNNEALQNTSDIFLSRYHSRITLGVQLLLLLYIAFVKLCI